MSSNSCTPVLFHLLSTCSPCLTHRNVNSAAYGYNSETLNASSVVIDALLNSNPLSVNGNIANNASASSSDTDGDVVSTATMQPTAISAETGGSESSLTPSATLPSLFSGYVISQRLQRRQAVSSSSSPSSTSASRTSSSSRSSVKPTATVRSTTNYLGAVMASANLTVGGLLTTPSASASATSSSGGGGGGNQQSLAMIILYAITGLVVALFVVVIGSGAWRAWRHPERYGPRAYLGGAGGAGRAGAGGAREEQGRTRGLTRAILDTFPVVRFGGGGGGGAEEGRRGVDEEAEVEGVRKAGKDGEGEYVEMAVLPAAGRANTRDAEDLEDGEREEREGRGRSDSRSSVGRESFHSAVSVPQGLNHRSSSTSLDGGKDEPFSPLAPPIPTVLNSSPPPSSSISTSPPPPSAGIVQGGDEADSCPICFTEFEEGEELRILPCDQRHIFHMTCIDPVRLSPSLPLPLPASEFFILTSRLTFSLPSSSLRSGSSKSRPRAPSAASTSLNPPPPAPPLHPPRPQPRLSLQTRSKKPAKKKSE